MGKTSEVQGVKAQIVTETVENFTRGSSAKAVAATAVSGRLAPVGASGAAAVGAPTKDNTLELSKEWRGELSRIVMNFNHSETHAQKLAAVNAFFAELKKICKQHTHITEAQVFKTMLIFIDGIEGGHNLAGRLTVSIH